MRRFITRSFAVLIATALAMLGMGAGATSAQAGTTSTGGLVCRQIGDMSFQAALQVDASVPANEPAMDVTFQYGTDLFALSTFNATVQPGENKTFYIDVPLETEPLATYYYWPTGAETPSMYEVPICWYEPTLASANITAPRCLQGDFVDGSINVSSSNSIYGEELDIKFDGVTLPGWPKFLSPGAFETYPFDLPITTTVGTHNFTVYNRGVLLSTVPFVLNTLCEPDIVHPDRFLVEVQTPLCDNGQASQVVTVTNNDVQLRFVEVSFDNAAPIGWVITKSQLTHDFLGSIPSSQSYSIKVTTNGYTLYDTVQPAFSCAPPAPVRTSGPTLAGKAAVGSVLTCTAAYTDATSQTWGWTRNGVIIPGAVSNTYKLVPADFGKRVACTSGASGPGGSVPTASSAASAVVAAGPALRATVAPKVTGVPKVGKTLKAYVGRWTPSATSYSYQWLVKVGKKFVPIKRATKAAYKLPATFRGKYVAVRVTAKAYGYASGVKTTAAVRVK